MGKPALFLDRDGVINVDRGYVHRVEDFEFVPGIFDLCRRARALDYLLLVVTNQAGIGRGYYTELDFAHVTNWMLGRFHSEAAPIAAVYFCPFHPEHGVGRYRAESADRKPGPGMLLRARRDFDLDLAESVMIGDKESDMQAAAAAGVGTRILLRATASDPDEAESSRSHVAHSLPEAAAILEQVLSWPGARTRATSSPPARGG